MVIDIRVGVQLSSRRTVFIVLEVTVVIIIIAMWIGNFLRLLSYLFFLMVGFFLIALDTLATEIFRD